MLQQIHRGSVFIDFIELNLRTMGKVKVKKLESLGQGAQGSVYKVELDRKLYSLKIYNKDDESSVMAQRRARLVYESISPKSKSLQRAWMVDYGSTSDQKPVLLNNLFPHPQFEGFFSKFKPPANIKIRQKIAVGLTAGILEVHKNGIIHADLAPNNVLLSEKGEVAIIDFDGSGYYPKNSAKKYDPIVRGHVQFPGWVVPYENLQHKVDFHSDIWWLSSIIMKAVTNMYPFFFLEVADKNSMKEFQDLCNGHVDSWPPKYNIIRKHSRFIRDRISETMLEKVRRLLNNTISTGVLSKVFMNYTTPQRRPTIDDLYINFRWRSFK